MILGRLKEQENAAQAYEQTNRNYRMQAEYNRMQSEVTHTRQQEQLLQSQCEEAYQEAVGNAERYVRQLTDAEENAIRDRDAHIFELKQELQVTPKKRR